MYARTDEDVHSDPPQPSRSGRDDPRIRAFIKSETEPHEPRRELLMQFFEKTTMYKYMDIGGTETWVIKSAEDNAVQSDACETVRNLTGGRMLEVPTGHFFTFEDPLATADAVKIALDGAAERGCSSRIMRPL
ncbi:hypothetical protein NM688_g8646 [Phlebia brevispora]|uniref:Uncharacterized protein n=1 Tax=Phlebia brevispora TaxID=194682 RepID=A0ACC1RR48_9APHY|nr:hypothetical protein NM688_g8646 [Phlebia brevispora]